MKAAPATAQEMLDRMLERLDQPLRLRNLNCLYCGRAFGEEILPTIEHVIGRRFVPKGSLRQQWNLIANACRPCNNIKANLEDDVAAISLAPDHNHVLDKHAIEEGQRKARRSMSRRTGKPVLDSTEEMKIVVPLGSNGNITFNMFAGPQLDQSRVVDLCFMHMRALFYMITYSVEARIGRTWVGTFAVAQTARRPDWGNQRFRAFMTSVPSWRQRVVSHSAEGHFRALIRRYPDETKALWAWALEWNKSVRNVGFFGEEDLVRQHLDALPLLDVSEMPGEGGSVLSFRLEEPLPDDEDTLFSLDGSADT
jgi:hypothetical protein